MGTRTRARHWLWTSGAALSVLWGTSAQAVLPIEKPWAQTPERFLETTPDHPTARPSVALGQAGFRTWSFRSDGNFAFAFRAAAEERQANLTPDAAGEISLALARGLAPELGLAPADLTLASVHPLEGWTTVFVAHAHRGLAVPRSFLVFGFKGAALTSIRNELVGPLRLDTAPRITKDDAARTAIEAARAWAPDAQLTGAAELSIWAPSDDPAAARLVWTVPVSSQQPRAELTFQIDARAGALLAADDQVRHAEGEGRIRMRVHPVNSDSGVEAFTVPRLSVGGAVTDGDGELVAPGSHTVRYDGPWVRISEASGGATERLDLDMSGPYQVYDLDPSDLTQADPFVHTNLIKGFARRLTPTMGWVEQRLTANVNINDVCNAFWDGRTINFFRAGRGCNNTGQISSIVYHEFGHGYHQNLTRNVVGSIGEGTGDFLAATFLDDPIVGRGFSTNGSGIRRIDGNNRFPDDYVNQVHQDGLIWATALWDLREALTSKHGDWAGRLIVDRAFVRAVSRGPGLSTAYPSILEGDDDDGDISNGTPNSCEINAAFAAHGLIEGGQINHQQVPGLAYPRIEHDAPGRFAPDAEGAVTLSATVRNLSSCGSVDVADVVLYVARDGVTWVQESLQPAGQATQAVLTGLEPGAIFSYRFEIVADGRTYRLGSEDSPLVGIVDLGLEDLVSESFEAGFGDWTHGVTAGDLRDDWEIASPLGRSYDPFEAKHGSAVVGTDLGDGGGYGGSDGAAKAGRATFLASPPLSTEGMENVHLELWQHHAIAGSLRVLVDGQEVHRYDGAGNAWSGGWRYLVIPLGETASDRPDVEVRFEVTPNANNELGGWTLDGLTLSGTEIPPPPPPPPPPEEEPPPPETPGQVPTDPLPPEDTPMNPEEPEAPVGFTRNALGGGCTCAAPDATPGPGAAGLAVLGLLALGATRRRRR